MSNSSDETAGGAPAAREPSRLQQRLRGSRALILFEFAAVAAIFVADKVFHVIWLSETLYLFALGAISLMARGVKWRDIGFEIPSHWPWLVLVGLIAGGLIEAQELLFTQPLLMELTGRAPDLSDFHGVRGNWNYVWLGVPLIWGLAAFGEEWVYRGWLTNRLADLFGRRWTGWVTSVVVANVIFAVGHLYQGPVGMIEAGEDGLLFALVYFATGRNLIAGMIAHGVQDSTDLFLAFTGNYPVPI